MQSRSSAIPRLVKAGVIGHSSAGHTMKTDTGEQLAQAIAAKDEARLEALLSPDVDFRALTPGRFWEASSASDVVHDIFFRHWFEPKDHIDELQNVECDTVGDRQRVGYRFLVTNGDGAFVVEQQAYFGTTDGRIDWLRIMCSGFRPVPPPAS
jgi:hypothetical protein